MPISVIHGPQVPKDSGGGKMGDGAHEALAESMSDIHRGPTKGLIKGVKMNSGDVVGASNG